MCGYREFDAGREADSESGRATRDVAALVANAQTPPVLGLLASRKVVAEGNRGREVWVGQGEGACMNPTCPWLTGTR